MHMTLDEELFLYNRVQEERVISDRKSVSSDPFQV